MFIKTQPRLAELLIQLSNCEEFGEPPDFQKYTKILNFWSTITGLVSSSIILLYSFLRLSKKKQCQEMVSKVHLERSCGLTGDIWIPFDTNNITVFIAIHIWILTSTLIVLSMGLRTSFNIFEISYLIALKIKHLEKMLFESVQKNNGKIRVKSCILYHKNILKYGVMYFNFLLYFCVSV